MKRREKRLLRAAVLKKHADRAADTSVIEAALLLAAQAYRRTAEQDDWDETTETDLISAKLRALPDDGYLSHDEIDGLLSEAATLCPSGSC